MDFYGKRGYLIGKFLQFLFYPSCEIGIVLESFGFLLPDLTPHFLRLS